MKSKQFVIDEHTTITIAKRSSSRSIRLTIAQSGSVRVSIPTWMPYKVGIEFAKSKTDWIQKQRPEIQLLTDGQQIGKSHHLRFKGTFKNLITTRILGSEAIVYTPELLTIDNSKVQLAAKRIAKKALLAQAEQLLPQRLDQLATKYGYSYNSLRIKSLKTRWGSCDGQQNISLNLFLMELPWELIDYVIVHELNHTLVMHHGPKFWQTITAKLPGAIELRKQLKQHQATI